MPWCLWWVRPRVGRDRVGSAVAPVGAVVEVVVCLRGRRGGTAATANDPTATRAPARHLVLHRTLHPLCRHETWEWAHCVHHPSMAPPKTLPFERPRAGDAPHRAKVPDRWAATVAGSSRRDGVAFGWGARWGVHGDDDRADGWRRVSRPVRDAFQANFDAGSRGGGGLRRLSPGREGGRPVGWDRRRDDGQTVGRGHHGPRLLDHQGRHRHVRQPAGPARSDRRRGAGGDLLARVRPGREGEGHGGRPPVPPGRPGLDRRHDVVRRHAGLGPRSSRPWNARRRRGPRAPPTATTPPPTAGWWARWSAGSAG